MSLDPRSEEKLLGVRPELVKVIREAANRTKFRVTEGLRSKERQKMLVAQRKSKTMASRHITGHAIDFIAIGEDGVATYDDDDMRRVADVIRTVADEQGVKIERGIDWGWDSPHIELHRKTYPAKDISATRKLYETARDHPKSTLTTVAVGSQALEEVATPAADVATSVAATAKDALSSIPAPPDLSGVQAWSGIAQWATDNPFTTGLCALWIGGVWFWPKIKGAYNARFA